MSNEERLVSGKNERDEDTDKIVVVVVDDDGGVVLLPQSR